MKFSPSLMCMDFLNMREELEILDARTDLHHVDIMDGHFCPNITLSPDMVKTFKKVVKKPIDCHLMTTNPEKWIEKMAAAGATYISPHAETINVNAFRTMSWIKSLGCKTGVVLNPSTPLSFAEAYLGRVDLLTLMTVDVGFAGQPFIDEVLDKIRLAKQWREERGYTYEIQIDGCCGPATYKKMAEAGADILVMGTSGLFGKEPTLDQCIDRMHADFDAAIKG